MSIKQFKIAAFQNDLVSETNRIWCFVHASELAEVMALAVGETRADTTFGDNQKWDVERVW